MAYPAGTDVGKTVRNEVNPGGSVNQTVTTFEPSASDTGASCEQTELRHSHTTTRTDSAPTEEAEPPAVNEDHAVTSSLGDDGLWEVRETTVEHKPKEGLEFSSHVTGLRSDSTTPYRNQPAPLSPSGPVGSASFSLNDHGSYDGTVTETELVPDEDSHTSVTNALYDKVTTHFVNGEGPRDAGYCSDASAQEDQNGKWSGTTSSETPHPLLHYVGPYTSTEVSPFGSGTITVVRVWKAVIFSNQETVPELRLGPGDFPGGATGEGWQNVYNLAASHNKYGLIDGKLEVTAVAKAWSSGGSGGSGSGSGSAEEPERTVEYTTTSIHHTVVGIDRETDRPVVLEVVTYTHHRLGINCATLPEGMLEGSSVMGISKTGKYTYHAITGIEQQSSSLKQL